MKDIETLHREACKNEEDTYIDPTTGLSVLTAYFLSLRTFCCNGDCRHCPYPKTQATAAK